MYISLANALRWDSVRLLSSVRLRCVSTLQDFYTFDGQRTAEVLRLIVLSAYVY